MAFRCRVCHTTAFFPINGIIYPRMIFRIPKNFLPEQLEYILTKIFNILRPTVHFTLNSSVQEHKDYGLTNKHFVIIDKFNNSMSPISGGYIEDVFCIGPYKLSNEATILVDFTL